MFSESKTQGSLHLLYHTRIPGRREALIKRGAVSAILVVKHNAGHRFQLPREVIGIFRRVLTDPQLARAHDRKIVHRGMAGTRSND
jgi:hypothetical protein